MPSQAPESPSAPGLPAWARPPPGPRAGLTVTQSQFPRMLTGQHQENARRGLCTRVWGGRRPQAAAEQGWVTRPRQAPVTCRRPRGAWAAGEHGLTGSTQNAQESPGMWGGEAAEQGSSSQLQLLRAGTTWRPRGEAAAGTKTAMAQPPRAGYAEGRGPFCGKPGSARCP